MAVQLTWYNTLQDDSGSNTDGTVIDKADFLALIQDIDAGGVGALTGASATRLSAIAFAATQAASADANTLDDYEEGTWSPGGNGVTPTVASARYTKKGREVTITADVTWPSTGDTGQARITNVPFTAGVDVAAAIGYNGSAVLAEAFLSGTTLFFYAAPNNGGTQRTNAEFSQDQIKISCTFTV